MRDIRKSFLLITILALFFATLSFNAATQDSNEVQVRSFSSYGAILNFLNTEATKGTALENVQIAAAFDGNVTRYNIFFREGSGQGSTTPWVVKRFNMRYESRFGEVGALEQATEFVQNYLNYVGGDFSEPHLALRSAAISAYGTPTTVNFAIFHREEDRGDPNTYGWDWLTRFGDRELSTLLQQLNGTFQEDPRVYYPSDLLSLVHNNIDEHVYYNYYQVGMVGNSGNTPTGWEAQTYTNTTAVLTFLNSRNPEEFRIATDYSEITERFRVFYR